LFIDKLGFDELEAVSGLCVVVDSSSIRIIHIFEIGSIDYIVSSKEKVVPINSDILKSEGIKISKSVVDACCLWLWWNFSAIHSVGLFIKEDAFVGAVVGEVVEINCVYATRRGEVDDSALDRNGLSVVDSIVSVVMVELIVDKIIEADFMFIEGVV